MERIWHNYAVWEDWKAGQYGIELDRKQLENAMACRCAALLSSPPRFQLIAEEVIERWPLAAEQQLSNIGRNRRAWLGQAACCIAIGAPDYITKAGWHMMTPAAQIAANEVATNLITQWELGHAESGHREERVGSGAGADRVDV